MEGSRELSSFPRLRRAAGIGRSARSPRTRGSPRLPLAAARDDVALLRIMRPMRPLVCCSSVRRLCVPLASVYRCSRSHTLHVSTVFETIFNRLYETIFNRLYETVVVFAHDAPNEKEDATIVRCKEASYEACPRGEALRSHVRRR